MRKFLTETNENGQLRRGNLLKLYEDLEARAAYKAKVKAASNGRIFDSVLDRPESKAEYQLRMRTANEKHFAGNTKINFNMPICRMLRPDEIETPVKIPKPKKSVNTDLTAEDDENAEETESQTGKRPAPVRSEGRKNVEFLRKKHNIATLTCGSMSKLIKSEENIADIDSFMLHLASHMREYIDFSNNCRFSATSNLNQFFSSTPDSFDLASIQTHFETAQLSAKKQAASEKAGRETQSKFAGRKTKNLQNLLCVLMRTDDNAAILTGRGDWFNLNQLARQMAGNLKTMIATRFLPVLSYHIAFQLQKKFLVLEDEFRFEVFIQIATVLARWILGRRGKIRGEPENPSDDTNLKGLFAEEGVCDEDDSNELACVNMPGNRDPEDVSAIRKSVTPKSELEETEKGFRDSLRRWVGKRRTKGDIKPNPCELTVCNSLLEKPMAQLRQELLPAYVSDTLLPTSDAAATQKCESGWLSKLSANGYQNVGIFWKIAFDVNKILECTGRPICQALFPTPKCGAAFIEITTTRLAAVWTYWLKKHGNQNDQLLKERFMTIAKELEICTTDKMHPLILPIDGNISTLFQTWVRNPRLLWRLIFPGIHEFVQKDASRSNGQRLEFLNSARISGDCIDCQFADLKSSKTVTKKGIHSPSDNTYNSRQWQYRCGPGLKPITIDELAGRRSPEKPGLSGIHMNGFTGYMHLEPAVESGLLEIGEPGLQQMVDDRVIIGIDPGVVFEVGMIAVRAKYNCTKEGERFVDGFFKKSKRRGSARYKAMGVDQHMVEAKTRLAEFNANVTKLSENHGRTVDQEGYLRFKKIFSEETPALINSNHSEPAIQSRTKLRRRKQRYWSRLMNRVLALVDSMYTKDELKSGTKSPIVVIGGGSFGACRGHRSAAPAKLIDMLRRHFMVVIVDEHLTSQKCPKCYNQLKQLDNKSVRYWRCENGACQTKKDQQFVVNKDISAAMHMFNILVSTVGWGRRPVELRKRDGSSSKPTATIKTTAGKKRTETVATKQNQPKAKANPGVIDGRKRQAVEDGTTAVKKRRTRTAESNNHVHTSVDTDKILQVPVEKMATGTGKKRPMVKMESDVVGKATKRPRTAASGRTITATTESALTITSVKALNEFHGCSANSVGQEAGVGESETLPQKLAANPRRNGRSVRMQKPMMQ